MKPFPQQQANKVPAGRSAVFSTTNYGMLVLFQLGSLAYFIIDGPKRVVELAVCAFVSVGVAFWDAQWWQKVRSQKELLLISLLFPTMPFLASGSETTLMLCWTLPIYVIFGLVSAASVVRCVQCSNDKVPKLGLLCLVCFLCVWAYIYSTHVRGATTTGYSGFQEANTGGDFTTLFGVFKYGNIGYTVTYFILIPIAVCPLFIHYGGNAFTAILFLAGGFSVFEAMTMARRGPILTLVVSFALLLFLKARRTRRISVLLLPMALGLAGVLVFSAVIHDPRFASQFSEFSDRLPEIRQDARLTLWMEGLNTLLNHPFGGRSNMQSESLYAHSLFLDLGLDYGFYGAVCGLVFVGYAFGRALKAIPIAVTSRSEVPTFLLIIGLTHGCMMMTEPPVPERIVVFVWALTSFIAFTKNRQRLPRREAPSRRMRRRSPEDMALSH